ncbi:Phosphomannomutase/phosphoglucomutase [BD1-7 clade bacterium]|uniref:phosphomannomutase n=1 Tax=BD1-7 clade bacterium TaxID=2029982 RepID=A0A5S9N5U6_9GAMM|nr:Phosphomannomutase/phosphoglucomutase [BD1-7 clade bacterium]CAA0084222.1 Phosphomannomutase/phosphoglucomutase [BD1-7 clade bacterium]
MSELTCFKAYDVRGRIPDQLNEDIAYRIGAAYAQIIKPQKVVVNYDIRITSPAFCDALSQGMMDQGVDVYNAGLGGTEQVYFATFHYGFDGGIAVTASHNPKDYNGMKFVREDSKPISSDTGLLDIKALAEANDFTPVAESERGTVHELDLQADYAQHLLGYIDADSLNPMKLVVNAGNGGAGTVIDLLEPLLPQIEFIKVHHNPDGEFPNGVPNPLLEENRPATIDAVKAHGADFGIAWDGDFDRCFLFDEQGNFIEGYYIVGLLAEAFLSKGGADAIVHDPRLTWNTIDIVEQSGGRAVQSKTGHAFIKERMRKENAVYGGEMSAHHYFRDFAYCDSGMIPWLLVADLISKSGKGLSTLVSERVAAFPCSGEINRKLDDAKAAIARVKAAVESDANDIDYTDGLSVSFDNWRFSVRSSNTEPVLRLNVESRGDEALMREKTEWLLSLIEA